MQGNQHLARIVLSCCWQGSCKKLTSAYGGALVVTPLAVTPLAVTPLAVTPLAVTPLPNIVYLQTVGSLYEVPNAGINCTASLLSPEYLVMSICLTAKVVHRMVACL